MSTYPEIRKRNMKGGRRRRRRKGSEKDNKYEMDL